jgi:signal transduction histidine kinase
MPSIAPAALQSLLDASGLAVFLLQAGRDLQSCNTLASQWWAEAGEAERQELQQWCAAAPAAALSPSRPAVPRETTLVWAVPQRRVLQVRSVALAGEGAESVTAVYLQDITQAHDIDRMKSDFLSAAAHELRTPLASIYGFAELMLLRTMAPEKQKDLLGTIHRQAKSLMELINELLDLSRIEARQGKDLHIAPCAVADLVEGTVSGLHYKADKHRLYCELTHGEYIVLADAEKTRQALLNVLSNAVKYSPLGGDITVSTVQRSVAGSLQVGLRVSDQGLGMSEEQCRRAFERFYRAEPLGDIPGTGLGLSLVQEIMQLQSGEVALDSVLGEGTTVTLWLPSPGGPELGAEPELNYPVH